MKLMRRTKSVNSLLEVFDHSNVAFSAIDLVRKLETKMNKTTVYRILDRLVDEGVLHSFVGKDGLKWYAKCKECTSSSHTDLHPHFQCRKCGKTKCLNLEISMPRVPHHSIDGAELLLLGKCEDCHF